MSKKISKKAKTITVACLGTVSLAAVGFTALGASFYSGKAAGGNGTWTHYNKIDPTDSDYGIKEYWVSCETNKHVFTKPVGATVVDGTSEQQARYITPATITPADDRCLAKGTHYIFKKDAGVYVKDKDKTTPHDDSTGNKIFYFNADQKNCNVSYYTGGKAVSTDEERYYSFTSSGNGDLNEITFVFNNTDTTVQSVNLYLGLACENPDAKLNETFKINNLRTLWNDKTTEVDWRYTLSQETIHTGDLKSFLDFNACNIKVKPGPNIIRIEHINKVNVNLGYLYFKNIDSAKVSNLEQSEIKDVDEAVYDVQGNFKYNDNEDAIYTTGTDTIAKKDTFSFAINPGNNTRIGIIAEVASNLRNGEVHNFNEQFDVSVNGTNKMEVSGQCGYNDIVNTGSLSKFTRQFLLWTDVVPNKTNKIKIRVLNPSGDQVAFKNFNYVYVDEFGGLEKTHNENFRYVLEAEEATYSRRGEGAMDPLENNGYASNGMQIKAHAIKKENNRSSVTFRVYSTKAGDFNVKSYTIMCSEASAALKEQGINLTLINGTSEVTQNIKTFSDGEGGKWAGHTKPTVFKGTLHLEEGVNELELSYPSTEAGNDSFNLDRLELTTADTGATLTQIRSGEDGVPKDNAVYLCSCDAALITSTEATGSKTANLQNDAYPRTTRKGSYVGFESLDGTGLLYTFYSDTSFNAKVSLRWACKAATGEFSIPNYFSITYNGGDDVDSDNFYISLPDTPIATGDSEKFKEIPLGATSQAVIKVRKGINTFKFRVGNHTTNHSINIDYFKLEPTDSTISPLVYFLSDTPLHENNIDYSYNYKY